MVAGYPVLAKPNPNSGLFGASLLSLTLLRHQESILLLSSPRCDRTRGCGGKKPEFPAAAQVVRFNLQVNFTCTNLLTFGRSEFSGVRAHGHEVRVILL